MSDITTVWNTTNGDWQQAGASLKSGGDLQTAILISVFSDRVALPSDTILDGSNDPRGWCGDDPTTPIGSRIWLLERSKQTTQVLGLAKSYLAEALQWLIDAKIVASFDILTEWTAAGTLGAQITAHKPVGAALSLNFQWAWTGIN